MFDSSVMIKSLPIVAKAIGRNMGVEVILDAGHPRTNGEQIFLPSLPLEDPGVETLGLSYIIHEAGHIRYSDFSIDYAEYPPMVVAFAGRMEDIRMEKRVISDYPGAQKRLAELVVKLVQDGFFMPVERDSHPATVLSAYVLYKLRYLALGQDGLAAYAEQADSFLRELMTSSAMTRVDSIMARVSWAKSERDIVDLAMELTQVLEEESKSPEDPQDSSDQPPESGGQPEQGGDNQDSQQDAGGQDSNSQSDGTGDSNTSLEPSSQNQSNPNDSSGNGDNSNQTGSDGADDKAKKQAMQSMMDTSQDMTPTDISEAFESLVEEELKKASDRGNHAVSMKPNFAEDTITPMDHDKAINEAQAATALLRSRMVQLVQAQTKAKRKTSRSGRRINDRKLVRTKVNNLSVFKSTSKEKAVNTTIQVLLDRSSSMSGLMELATRTTLSLTAAMKQIPHLEASASVFPGYGSSAVTVLTKHNETMHQTAGYYPNVSASGSTPLLPALIWSGDNLMAEKQPRKLLFIVTDGVPSQFDRCKETIADLRKAGIEVYGLGIDIDKDKMSELFNGQYAEIEDETKLAEATFQMLEEALFAA